LQERRLANRENVTDFNILRVNHLQPLHVVIEFLFEMAYGDIVAGTRRRRQLLSEDADVIDPVTGASASHAVSEPADGFKIPRRECHTQARQIGPALSQKQRQQVLHIPA
jgi:hypothetical protein